MINLRLKKGDRVPDEPGDGKAALDEEAAYLQLYPDVARAVRFGLFASALDHYLRYGRSEGRRWPAADRGSTAGAEHSVVPGAPRHPAAPEFAHNCEVAFVTRGYLFVNGWADDRADGLVGIEVVMSERVILRHAVYRYRREDVETHVSAAFPFEGGFWGMIEAREIGPAVSPGLQLRLTSGRTIALTPVKVVRLDLRGLFAAFMAFFAERRVLGNAIARSLIELGSGLAPIIAQAHRAIRATYARTSEGCYGRARPLISFVCCLYGAPEFLFLQVAQFARYGSLDKAEFIYVNNSPELEAILHRDAEIAAYLFATSVRVISLNQNTGFSHANNVGIARAHARLVVAINPDVFPTSSNGLAALWALSRERLRTQVIGGRLFYADGSVMHEGMYCTLDASLSAQVGSPVCTVEHHRKGFPEREGEVRKRVAAVSGALMVARRSVWESLGGFDEDFVYGHYEDADLCLRLKQRGGVVAYEPCLSFWHFEGMGAVHRPEHGGAALYNRWLFSHRWGSELQQSGHEATP